MSQLWHVVSERVGRRAAALLLVVASVSCTVGPRYQKPAVPVPPAYRELPGWANAQPDDAALRGDWWQLFGDSELSSLELDVSRANPTLRAAEASFRRARAAIGVNAAALYPTLSAGPSITTDRVSANSPTGSVTARGRTFGNFNLPFDLSYEIDLWGRIRRTIAASRAEFQAAAADEENVKLSLQSELASDFFNARLLDSEKEVLANSVAAFQKALDLTNNRYEGGIASREEVTQAETQLRQTEAQLIDVDEARAQREHAIAVLIGKNPEDYQLQNASWKRPPPPVPLGMPSALLQRRPDIAVAEREMAAANEQIGIARAAFYPQLVITANGGFQSGSIVDWFSWPSRFWALGPQANQLFLDGGRRRAVLAGAQAAYDQTTANYQQVTLNAFREVEDNLAALRVLEKESAKQHDAVNAAERSVELAVNRYKGGIVTYLEVITAQSTALTNQRLEVDLLRRRLDASILLVKALGGGWSTAQLP